MNSSSTANKVIFSLIDKNDADILHVDMTDCDMGEKEIHLNDGTQCQTDLKDVFLLLVQTMTVSEVEVLFIENKEYPRELIHSAMKAFVDDLSKEVQTVAAELDSEMSELESSFNETDNAPRIAK